MNVNRRQRASDFWANRYRERLLERLILVGMRQAVESFLLNCQVEELSLKTVSFYRGILDIFLGYCEETGLPPVLSQISPDEIRRFLVYVKERKGQRPGVKVSAWTTRAYYAALSAFFNWAQGEGFVQDSPMANIKPPKTPKMIIPIYSQEDVKLLLGACPQSVLGIRNRAMIIMDLDTGLRLSELVGILLEDVSIPGGLVKVRGKGAKERIVHFGKLTKQALLKYLVVRPKQECPQLWLTEEGKPLTARGFQIAFRRLTQKVGLKGRCTVHMLRHTAATVYLKTGDPLTLQYLLGHSSLAMVQHYTESGRAEQAVRQHEKSSPVERFLG
jgi:site-specific recombinase XerD